jgi:hypothetical protein
MDASIASADLGLSGRQSEVDLLRDIRLLEPRHFQIGCFRFDPYVIRGAS